MRIEAGHFAPWRCLAARAVRESRRALAGSALLAATLASAAAAPGGVVVYQGTCDASAAVALDPTHFVVADDERDVLLVYRLGQGAPVATVDLTAVLSGRAAGRKTKESDLEGGARIGERIYWIGSHSRDRKGRDAPHRRRLLATDIVAGVIPTVRVPVSPPYTGLLEDFAADPRFAAIRAAAAAGAPESAGGLNIEGLAATPDGRLLIGFRNPRPGGRAIVVPLENPAAVVDRAQRAKLGDPMLLDLGARGIRSIDWVGDRFVIVAGPHDDGGAPGGPGFALYDWAGEAADVPRPWAGVDLGTLGPEGLFLIPGTRQVHVVSDDGERCKARSLTEAQRTFRAITLDLPASGAR
jgi:hypothetical protein